MLDTLYTFAIYFTSRGILNQIKMMRINIPVPLRPKVEDKSGVLKPIEQNSGLNIVSGPQNQSNVFGQTPPYSPRSFSRSMTQFIPPVGPPNPWEDPNKHKALTGRAEVGRFNENLNECYNDSTNGSYNTSNNSIPFTPTYNLFRDICPKVKRTFGPLDKKELPYSIVNSLIRFSTQGMHDIKTLDALTSRGYMFSVVVDIGDEHEMIQQVKMYLQKYTVLVLKVNTKFETNPVQVLCNEYSPIVLSKSHGITSTILFYVGVLCDDKRNEAFEYISKYRISNMRECYVNERREYRCREYVCKLCTIYKNTMIQLTPHFRELERNTNNLNTLWLCDLWYEAFIPAISTFPSIRSIRSFPAPPLDIISEYVQNFCDPSSESFNSFTSGLFPSGDL